MVLGGSSPLQANPQARDPQEKQQAIPQGKIQLYIGLPPNYGPSIPQRMSAIISDDMDVEELSYHLAKRLGVNRNRWKLIVISDEKGPYALDKRRKLRDFQSNRKERLYFSPEIRVR